MADLKPLSIHVAENGPIRIEGEQLEVTYCGEPVKVEEGQAVYLCRCGESQNAPFCDGNHSRTGFVAEDGTGDRNEVRVWEGKTIRTYFNPNACMHVFKCKPLKALRERELEGDALAAAEIARVVMTCPSGALTYESTAVTPPQPEQGATVEIIEGGEIRIQCAFDINTNLQERQPGDRATLCRCGLSRNKPWCDGQHKKRENFR
jgi:CDGSH-type Zn-finger protein